MQRFDCLSRDCPLFGPHLLEASAGTGKTFSIEHIFVRLILESIEVEQILAVTFTRAATRELKMRIRANLEKALALIREEATDCWPYLSPHLGSLDAIRRLTDALGGFDRCQIFTIHGFCYRMLKEFSFEAKVGSLSNPEEGKKIPPSLRQAVSDFLESGMDKELLCPEQLTLLFKQFESVEELAERLLRLERPEPSLSFSEIFAKCKAALHVWNLEESKLLEDFRALEKGYKAEVKGNFEMQVRGLANLAFFPALLKERGSLFDFLDGSNRKVREYKPSSLHYPGFFDWAQIHIAPLVRQKVFPTLQTAWNSVAKKILSQEEYLDPDEILVRMKKAVDHEVFAHCVRQKYAAAIIDEFQDTDALQWEIFQRLFLEKPIRALYLVGDPKQSIYRFRKADIYTYLKARDLIGENHLYHLDTNFRSSQKLISALNALFSRDWLHLPKADRTLPYHPVKAGANVDSLFPDEKGALHFFAATGEPNGLFDTVFLPFAVSEIERLHLKKCAFLVKDRYQVEKALEFLKKRGIAAIARSRTPLSQTPAFQAICELFEALSSPVDKGEIVKRGPFAQQPGLSLEEHGLVPFARQLPNLDPDAMQIFEWLFAWEKREGFSFEGLKRALQHLQHLDPEEGGQRRILQADEEAIQIMTLHISKGLEFDVVFALGLASRTPEGDGELDAEKLRQLYVAMTRAKKRLYVPLALSTKDPDPGTHSPIELFSRYFEGPLRDQLIELSKTESITIEHLPTPFILGPASLQTPPKETLQGIASHPFTPFFLSSFTTLAKPREGESKQIKNDPENLLQALPRGPETGVVIHQIFEKLFSSSQPIWRDPTAMDALVTKELRFSPLLPWEEPIQQMVRQTVALPLQADGKCFTLSEIDTFQAEMEFVFSSPPHFIKGFIDLLFRYCGKIYFIDWKTNWLEDYGPAFLQKAMEEHDYGLQAALYAEAIQRCFQGNFGGAYYLFVRGGAYIRT